MSEALQMKETIDQLGVAFEQFKATNDERYEKLAKGVKDPLLEDRLAKIDKNLSIIDSLKSQLDDLETKSNRPGRTSEDPVQEEHKEAFEKFIRKGFDEGLGDIQQKAVSVGVDGDGGYAVTESLDSEIEKLARDYSPMRALCKVIKVSNEKYKKIVNVGGTASGWVGETDARPATGTATLKSLAPTFGEIYANPAVTQQSLDDLMYDVQGDLAEDVAMEFAEKEGASFISGNGTNKPIGLLAGTLSLNPDSSRTFGELQYMLSGTDSLASGDNLIDLIHKVKRAYRKNGKFMFSGLTLAMLRKLKDTEGNYIWQPGLVAGVQSNLLSYGYEENDDMTDPGDESNSIVFGDFRRAYTIADIHGTRMLRDPYTNKPYIHFYTTKRVGGMLVNSEAVKVLRLGDGS